MIVVTTPTGAIGRQVVQALLDAGAPVRVIARDPARLPERVRANAEVVEGQHSDLGVVMETFAGADAVFWLVPPSYRTGNFETVYVDFTRAACEAFLSQGVKRVVGVSALGRGTPVAGTAGLVSASLAMDDLIVGTGVAYRALALPSFMDNILRQVPLIRDSGTFTGPVSGDLRAPTCATRDIAAIAAGLLLDGSWSGQEEVPVLGPEDLSHHDMARIMSEVLGRPIRYQEVSGQAFKDGLLGRGASESMARGMLDMMRAKNAGLDNGVPRTLHTTSPTTFRQWCEEVLKPALQP